MTALAVGLAVRFADDPPSAALTPVTETGPALESTGGRVSAPDISGMSPRERADRLFDRVMGASERGDVSSVRFFGRMALDAYGMLNDLDDDAHYHLALIHMVTGDTVAARSALDALEASSPTHLLLSVARAELLRKSDPAALRREYRSFVDRFDAELATDRDEYRHHIRTLEAFQQEALRVLDARGDS